MDRISKTKKVIKALCIVFTVLFFIIVLNFGIHIYRTNIYNNELRTIDAFSDETNVLVDIHPRGMATDTWEKNDAFPDVVLKAKIYEATITNSSASLLHDWQLRIDIKSDCYINNAWNGTIEIHQNVDGVEKVQELSLQNYKESDLKLDYYLCGQDLLIPLSKGDYIVYLPSVVESTKETEIESTSSMIGEMNVGLIFYSLEGEEDLSSYEFTYYLQKSIWSGAESRIFIIASAIWLLSVLLAIVIIVLTNRYEYKINRQYDITNEFLEVFANYVDAKDNGSGGHSKEVANIAKKIALKLGMRGTDADNVYYAALVHDIGKCYVPDYILKKPTKLTNEEYETVKSHTTKGAEMLKECKSIAYLADGALYHHEWYDGTGYPTGKAGEEIPLIGRIICVADCYNVMSNGVVYKEKSTEDKILEELKAGSGTQFDPMIVDALIDVLKEKDMENWEIE